MYKMESDPEMEIETNNQEVGSDDDGNIFDEDDEPAGNRADEAEEVPAPGADGEAKSIKPKKVIKRPQPKLDALRLMGPRGLGIIHTTFKELKFKGKGHEREDLRLLMKKIEHWTHRLFPKMPFDDTLKQIEKLGAKKQIQNLVKRIRLDMYQSDEMYAAQNTENDLEINEEETPEVDVFDTLLNTGPDADRRTEPISSQNLNMVLPIPQVVQETVLTTEQRERVARNRLLAIEKRQARLLQLHKENEAKITTSAQESSHISSAFEKTTTLSTHENTNESPFKNSNGQSPNNTEIEEKAETSATTAIDNSSQSSSLKNVTDGDFDKEMTTVEDKNEHNADKDSTEIRTDKVIQQEENATTQTVKDVNLVSVDDMLDLINTDS